MSEHRKALETNPKSPLHEENIENNNRAKIPNRTEDKEFTLENIKEWKYDLISEKLKNEAKDRLEKYKFEELENFQDIEPVKLYSEIDPNDIAVYSFAGEVPIEDIHSINDLINIVGVEKVNEAVRKQLRYRIKTLKKVEQEYKAILEFFANPSDQTNEKFKNALYYTHPNHEYAFSVSSANLVTRLRFKQNVRTGKYLFSSMINEDVIDASAEYQEIRCPMDYQYAGPPVTRVSSWTTGFILHVMDTYEIILEGYKNYFVNLIKQK